MFTTKKIALVSVINDLVTDNRVKRTCLCLHENGFEVLLIGRKLPDSLPIPEWPYKAMRMKLLFTKGPAFYLFFNLRLFFVLLFKRANLLYANDLDTLLPNYLASKLKGVPLIYDSHELFCEVPELLLAPVKRKVWLSIEQWIVPKLNYCITVNDSIANIFAARYKTKFCVVKNISEAPVSFKPKSRKELGIVEDKKMLLMQGAGINIDRGAEELIDAMELVNEAVLYIIGGGDVWPVLEQKIQNKHLGNKIILIKKLPKTELLHYTFNADVGISIDKDTNLNYHYSLPNKLFDYLQAGIPVLASKLPEPEAILIKYDIGVFIPDHQPQSIADAIKSIIKPEIQNRLRQNMKLANMDLNWENEKNKLKGLIMSVKS